MGLIEKLVYLLLGLFLDALKKMAADQVMTWSVIVSPSYYY